MVAEVRRFSGNQQQADGNKMTWVVAGIGVVGLIAISWLAFRLGSEKANRKSSEKENKERAEDAKIASKPYTDRPFSRMRPKD